MAAAPAFILITVVLFVVGACLYSLKQHKAKQMLVQAEQMRAIALQQAMEQEAHLDAAGNHLALAVQGTQDGLWYWDLKADTFRFSSGWETLLGFAKGELSQNPDEWLSRVHPAYRAELDARIRAHLQGETEQFRYEHRMRRNDGSYFWVSARATVNRNGSGEALGLAGSHSDITTLIPVERELLDDAFHDRLTGLPNRHFFMGRLDTAVEQRRQEAHRNRLFAVMFLDLDRFKHINDTLGHQVGDQLLAGVARRLQSCVGPSDMVARLGGDEFVILLDCVRDAEEALRVGARISDAFASPFEIDGSEVMSGASIGIALSRERFEATEDLVSLADLAMYHSKTQRKGRPELFHERMKEQPTKLASRQSELARALKEQEFLLDYQPYFDMQSGRILGVEALIRWQSQNLVLSPSDFIPLAEETGLIHDIGQWVLRTACAQSRAWQKAGIPPVQMAVNVSAKQLHEADFAQRVVAVLDETKLAPRWLNLELTESALMDTYEKAPATHERLDTMGIGTSIDDFGTGYSSLNYLRRFNFQTLKMDRCFVSEIATNKKAAVIVKGLISIAHNLGISVIAEGVERHDQLRLLAAENCDHVQGFLTGRPVAPEQMLKLLRSVNVKKQTAPVTGGVRTLLDDCSEGILNNELGAMAEACRNWIEPGVESNDDSAVTLIGR
jgi:diguanylate cyclase (GGDEF)-like protein/PAS domain S-box-containing protein